MKYVVGITNILICLTDMYLFYDFTSGQLQKRNLNKWIKYICMLTWGLCLYFAGYAGQVLLKIMIGTIVSFVFSFCFFDDEWRKRLQNFAVYFVVMESSAGFCTAVSLILNLCFIQRNEGVSFTQYDILMLLLLVRMIVFLILKICKATMTVKDVQIERTMYLSMFGMPVSGFAIYTGIFYFRADNLVNATVVILIGSIGIMLTSIFAFFMFGKMIESVRKIQQLETKNLKIELQQKYYEQLEEKNRQHAEVIHNMHHYLEAIGGLAKTQQNDSIIEVLESIHVKISDYKDINYCKSSMLNSILVEKRAKAEDQGIAYEIKVDPLLMIDFVSDYDMIAMVGNLLDNAIEAAANCKEHAFIAVRIYMTEQNRFVMMEVSNSVAVVPIKVGDRFNTTKRDRENHGIGLESIQLTAEKYGGFLATRVKEKVFYATVMLSLYKK